MPMAPHNRIQRSQQSRGKWQAVGGSRERHEHNGIRPPPKLIDASDNEAEASWRARQPAQDTVRIPEELAIQSNHGDRYHEVIARQHSTFLFCEHQNGAQGSKTFGIWGDSKAVAATKKAITSWIETVSRTQSAHRASKFAKIQSLTPALRERAERRWAREVKRQRFRQHPPLEMAFGAIGTFHWPTNEYRPEEILGASYEALDPIRMDCECYIVFIKDRNVFRIMGKCDDVQKGLLRIRKVCFQIAARQVNSMRIYLLRWSEVGNIPERVVLDTHEHPAVLTRRDAQPLPTGRSLHGQGTDFEKIQSGKAEIQTLQSYAQLRTSILKTLKKLHYYHGSIQMRLRLGRFLANQFRQTKDDCYGLDDFETMIKQSQFIGSVTQEIGNLGSDNTALCTLQRSNHLLTPSDALTEDVNDVKPIYTAIFTLADGAGDLRLSVSWHETVDPDTLAVTYERESSTGKWTRLDRDSGRESQLLDVSVTHVSTGSAWQFDILASHAVEEQRLPQSIQNFARNLRIDSVAVNAQKPDRLFVLYNPYENLRTIQQRISYQYSLVNSDYTLELSRFQDHKYPEGKSVAGSAEPTVFEWRWSLTVFRKEWDTWFGRNARLPIGEGTDWSDDVESWFPKDVGPGAPEEADGFLQLMDKLRKVEDLIRSANNDDMEDLLGGMTVG